MKLIFDDRALADSKPNTNNTPILDIGTVPGGTNGLVDIFVRPNTGAGINHRQAAVAAFDGTWHHVAWVDDQGFGRIYVDGVQDTNEFNYLRGPLAADATCLGGVARTNGAIALFAGSLDDVHIWRRSLKAEEIRTVMDRVRIVGFDPGGASAVITYTTATPAANHQVEGTMDITGPWTDITDAVIAAVGPNTFTATFPAPRRPAEVLSRAISVKSEGWCARFGRKNRGQCQDAPPQLWTSSRTGAPRRGVV